MENAFGQPQSLVVLGGSSDIARALTRKLCAARTTTVVLAGRNHDLLAEAEEAEFVAEAEARASREQDAPAAPPPLTLKLK